jgi:hypothetical protein
MKLDDGGAPVDRVVALCVCGAPGACVGVLQVQRGERELELGFK